jgi:hypothetical protein
VGIIFIFCMRLIAASTCRYAADKDGGSFNKKMTAGICPREGSTCFA